MVRGYPGDQGEDEKGLPGAFASKDPSLAPSSQHLLFPPPTRPLKRKDPGLRIQTTTGPARRVSGAGWERDSRRERGREWRGSVRGRPWAGCPGLSEIGKGGRGEGSSLEGPRPTSLEGDAPQTTVISRQRRFERMSHPALPLLPASEPSISQNFQRRKPPSPTSCPPSPTAAARALSPWWTVLPARVLQLPCGRLNPQEITVLLKSPDPAYTTLAPSPWSSNHNSPEETLTAASQVFQNQRKKCFPTPRSPDRGARPHPLVPSLAGCPPRAGDSLYPTPGLGPQLVEDGGWGWGKLVLCAPKQLWALGTSNQKELKPPGARGIG